MLLAIETALAACSVALIDDDGTVIAELHEEIGRGHAERLVPMIREVMAAAGVTEAERIAVDVGPGSFTGLRVGIAAARAMGLAWKAEVVGYSSTALVAARAYKSWPDLGDVFAVLDAARGEVYLQAFDRDLQPLSDPVAVPPHEAVALIRAKAFVGPGSALLGGQAGPILAARDVVLLPASALSLPPRPIYVRPPDAKLPA